MVFLKNIFLIIISFFLFSCNTTIAIQPLGDVKKEYVENVKVALSNYYSCNVKVLKPIKIPEEAFINVKSPRYRADYLIKYLKEIKPSKYSNIIGLTEKDISTTKYSNWALKTIKEPKSRYEDFGIFGLGYRPGPSCIVSTFRLGKTTKLSSRLTKIACHEIGHNLGLPHCENKKCFMQDAAEKISTIDNVSLDLCNNCKSKL